MSNKVLITGATGGLGRKTALLLRDAGWHVVVGGRRRDAVDATVAEIRKAGGEASRFLADLGSLDEVGAALAELDGDPLRAIVANAGITLGTDQASADGYELTFAVNVLAHQLILETLVPAMSDGSRIVLVASGVHDPDNKLARRAGVPEPRWVGADAAARPHDAAPELFIEDTRQRYSNSKLANVLQARELAQRLAAQGRAIDVFAYDPGLMVDTDLARSYPAVLRGILRAVGTVVTPLVDNMRLSGTSAKYVARLLTDDALAGRGFAYFDGKNERPPSPDAQNDEYASTLRADANRLIGIESI